MSTRITDPEVIKKILGVQGDVEVVWSGREDKHEIIEFTPVGNGWLRQNRPEQVRLAHYKNPESNAHFDAGVSESERILVIYNAAAAQRERRQSLVK